MQQTYGTSWGSRGTRRGRDIGRRCAGCCGAPLSWWDACEASNLSNIAHGLAKCRLVGLDGDAGALFAAVAEAAALGGLGGFTPQELANTAWAFATAGQRAQLLLDAIAAAAVPRLRDFKPQGLANTAWAFARPATKRRRCSTRSRGQLCRGSATSSRNLTQTRRTHTHTHTHTYTYTDTYTYTCLRLWQCPLKYFRHCRLVVPYFYPPDCIQADNSDCLSRVISEQKACN